MGHCPTDTDLMHNKGFTDILDSYKKNHSDGERCDHGGCVLIGCETSSGPRLAFVDISMSRAFGDGRIENTRRAEFLLLENSSARPIINRYYNKVSRVQVGGFNKKGADTAPIVMWEETAPAGTTAAPVSAVADAGGAAPAAEEPQSLRPKTQLATKYEPGQKILSDEGLPLVDRYVAGSLLKSVKDSGSNTVCEMVLQGE